MFIFVILWGQKKIKWSNENNFKRGHPSINFLCCNQLRVSLPVKQYSLLLPQLLLVGQDGKGSKQNVRVEFYVCGGAMCMSSGRCSGNTSEDVYSHVCTNPVRSLCRWERTVSTRTTLVSTDSFLPEAASLLSRSHISTHFGLPWATFGALLTYLLAAIWNLKPFLWSALALGACTYLPPFCAAIRGIFLSHHVTALTTMQNSKMKPEKNLHHNFLTPPPIIFFGRSPLWSHHMCLHDIGCGMSKDLLLLRRERLL